MSATAAPISVKDELTHFQQHICFHVWKLQFSRSHVCIHVLGAVVVHVAAEARESGT